MSKLKRRPTLHDTTAIGLILFGLFAPSFIVVRPNRIENGIGMGFFTAAGDLGIPAAALLVLLISLTILPYITGNRKLISNSGLNAFRTLFTSLMIPTLAVLTAKAAGAQLIDMPSPARVSLGMGFWLVLLGLILLMQHNLENLSYAAYARLILLILVVGLLYMAYKSEVLDSISIVREFQSKSSRIGAEMVRHMQLAASAVVTGLFLSLFLAGQAYRYPSRRGMVMSFVNMAQVIPTLTFLGLIMIPLTQLAAAFPVLKKFGVSGIGFVPAYIVLTMYAILPMTTNILAGYNSIDPSVLEAAAGMGMTPKQVHRRVELPLVLPYIYAGFSTSLVQTVGNTILAGLVGGGGIGAILFLGLAQSAPDLVVLGALLVVSAAWILKLILGSLAPFVKGKVSGEVQYD